jgi:Tol biopolymer transport system component
MRNRRFPAALSAALALLGACADHDPVGVGPAAARTVGAPRAGKAPAGDPSASAILFSGSVIDQKTNERSHQIMRVNPDGSGLTQITSGPGVRRWPAWSKDRTKIAFVAAVGDQLELYVMNADGSGQQRLTVTDGWQEKHPVFMPGDLKIAYERNRKVGTGDTLQAEVRVVDVTGANDTDPGWSKTCTKSPYTCFAATGINSGQREPTVNDAGGAKKVTMSGLKWDGSVVGLANTQFGLVSFTLGSAVPQWMSFVGPARLTDPHWSHDGSKLAYVSGNSVHVWSASLNIEIAKFTYADPVTGAPVRLSDPSWSPDSKLLVAKASNGGLAVLDPFVLTVTPLLATSYSYGEPSWSR